MKTILVLIFMSTLAHAESKDIAPEKNPLGDNLMPIKFIRLAPGTFNMGSPAGDINSYDEVQHQVTLTHTFEMQITTVTQAQWYQIMKR